MPRGHPSPKHPDIHKDVLAAAVRDRRAALAGIAQWEKQHGQFTTEEMNEARRSVRAQIRASFPLPHIASR